MMDDTQEDSTSQDNFIAPTGARADLSPEEELDQDINNLSIEDSPAGPGVRIINPEVSVVPDTPMPTVHALPYDKALDVQIDPFNNSSSSSSSNELDIDNYTSDDDISDDTDNHQAAGDNTSADVQNDNWDNLNPTVSQTTIKETPFSSATDVVVDKNTGAITKKTTNANNAHHTQQNDIPSGCVSIKNYFKQVARPAANRTVAPNICTWATAPNATATVTTIANNSNTLPDNEPLPQRPARKRARTNTNSGTTPAKAPDPPNIDPLINTTLTNSGNNTTTITTSRNTPTAVEPTNTDKNVSFALQNNDQEGEFLPIPHEGLPFFRRARGCYSAEARANTRADHLERLSDNGKPPRWSYGIGPMPSYMKQVAKDLVNIKKRHALEFTRAVARSLTETALTSRRQGKLNLDTVENIYANDGKGFERASTKLVSLVSRDNGQEHEKLTRREELIVRSPTTDEDISEHLSGRKVATRSYAGVVPNDPPQANDNANQGNNPGNRQGRSRSRQRSRSRNRGGRANQANAGNRRNYSRSPMCNRDNQRNDDRNNRSNERRAANSGRGQRNGNRRQPRNNNFRQRDSAFDMMEKMFQFFQGRQ